MTFKDGVFSGNVLWYSEGTEESTLTAYYPYASEGTPSSFTVQADQNANKGYEASDFMAANKTKVNAFNKCGYNDFQTHVHQTSP